MRGKMRKLSFKENSHRLWLVEESEIEKQMFTQHQHLGQPVRQANGEDMPLVEAPVMLAERGRLERSQHFTLSSSLGTPTDRGFKNGSCDDSIESECEDVRLLQVNSPFAARESIFSA